MMTIEDYGIVFFIIFSASCLAIIKNLCKKNRELVAEKIRSDYIHYRDMEKMQESYEVMSNLYKHDIEVRDKVIEKHNLKVFYDIGNKDGGRGEIRTHGGL